MWVILVDPSMSALCPVCGQFRKCRFADCIVRVDRDHLAACGHDEHDVDRLGALDRQRRRLPRPTKGFDTLLSHSVEAPDAAGHRSDVGSMATSGKGTGIFRYNVQAAIEAQCRATRKSVA